MKYVIGIDLGTSAKGIIGQPNWRGWLGSLKGVPAVSTSSVERTAPSIQESVTRG